MVKEEDEASRAEVWHIEVLKELGHAQEALEDPWLEEVKLCGVCERDRQALPTLEGVGCCIKQCKAFYTGCSSRAHEECIDLMHSASMSKQNRR